jgi:VWFA-related protein
MPSVHFVRPATVLLALAAALLALTGAFAQNPAQPQAADQNVIRINVNLVQVDAVVTDSHDHLVPNLEASDFEVLQDGKPQKITNFSYINVRSSNVAPAPVTVAERKGAPAPPPVVLKPAQASRLLALVVDDMALSFDGTARVRGALKKFVDSDMQPGDLVAIIRTGSSMGALQQFTTDKRVLYAAIDRVRWNSMGRVGVGSFERGGGAYNAQFTDAMAGASLASIQYVVNGLHDLPGRKAVILFSENLRLFTRGMDYDVALQQARRLEDAANRSGVVIYSVDPRGLQTTSLTAADDTSKMSRKQINNLPMARATQIYNSQDGMVMLAKDTGGIFFHDNNDIASQLRKAVADTEGYYLLGYHPDPNTFDPKTGLAKFHKVEVKLTRAGLHIRSRSGFFGKSDSYAANKPVGRQAELAQALQSPFGENQIHVRLTTLFAQSPTTGSFVDAMLFVDAKDLKFTDQPDGWHKAVIDVQAVTFGEDGQAVDSSSKSYTLQYKDAAYQNALKNGIVYNLQQPVKKPGAYQLRVALRDADTEQLGSASEFIEIPDVSKGKLVLSSVVLHPYLSPDASHPQTPPADAAHPPAAPADAAQPPAAPADAAHPPAAPADAAHPQPAQAADGQVIGSPAMRTFVPGENIIYGYQILNPQLDSDHKPEIETYSRVFRDGSEIFTGKPQPLNSDVQTDLKKLISGGVLRLGANMKPGDYVLQVVVTDKLAKTTATQWSDFEVKDPALQ